MENIKHSEENEWMNDAPFLAGLDRTTPFSVPANYFEDLPIEIENKIIAASFANELPMQIPDNFFNTLHNEIMAKVEKEKSKTGIVISIKRWQMITLAAAASLILFAVIKFDVFTTRPSVIQTAWVDELSDENILAHIDEATLIEFICNESPVVLSDTSQIAIEEYLLDNNIDVNEITSNL